MLLDASDTGWHRLARHKLRRKKAPGEAGALVDLVGQEEWRQPMNGWELLMVVVDG